MSLRDHFPVLGRIAYLNAGTCGPSPSVAVQAAHEQLDRELREGRGKAHFEQRFALGDRLRAAYARRLGTEPAHVALTTGASDGVGYVMAAMGLGVGDEIISSDSEHPGLIGPLKAARDRGATVRLVPLADVADAIGPRTTLVAVQHVSWATGEFAPVSALAASGVPVVYDGAQSLGAVDVDVHALGCAAFAGPGQKWMCGSEATGGCYVAPEFADRVAALAPSYISFQDASAGLEGVLHTDARRYDVPSMSVAALAQSVAASDLLDAHDDQVRTAPAVAARFAGALRDELGLDVLPRDDTTLVAFRPPGAVDPADARGRLMERGVYLRDIPGTGTLRISVGAWNDENDLDRLLEALRSL